MKFEQLGGELGVCAGLLVLLVAGCTPAQHASSVAPASVIATSSVAATPSVEPTGSTAATDSDTEVDGGLQRQYLSRQTKGDAVSQGDPRRKAILDALRPVVEHDLGQKVKFEVSTLRTANGWAAFSGKPVRPDGGRIDYSRTHYGSWIKDGVFDEGVLALLRYTGGTWRVVEYSCGTTDYPGDAWLWDHKVKADLFWHS
jgi:hypothetical protein